MKIDWKSNININRLEMIGNPISTNIYIYIYLFSVFILDVRRSSCQTATNCEAESHEMNTKKNLMDIGKEFHDMN